MSDYSGFFEKIRKLRGEQDKQKQKGLNDFNLLTTVRKYHDEVHLHSAMIGALLNPNGLHYQKTLFLELFLKEIGLNEWGLVLDNVSVHVEYKNIDLYITDGIKHIIIENKIWADDQPCQITKYINIIVVENGDSIGANVGEDEPIVLNDNFKIIYLTAQSKECPDEHKVDSDGYIYFVEGKHTLEKCSEQDRMKVLVPEKLKNYKTKYKKITYKKEVLKWLENSKVKIANTPNLNEALSEYIEVVKMVTKDYVSKIKPIYKDMLEDAVFFKEAQEFYYEFENKYYQLKPLEKEAYTSYTEARKEITKQYFNNHLISYLKEKMGNKYKISCEFEGKDFVYKITVSDGKKEIIFVLETSGTSSDHYFIDGIKKFTKYRYRYAIKSINDFNFKRGQKANEYYLNILNNYYETI